MEELKIYQKTKEIKVGNISIGGMNHVVIQSMTNIKTSNVSEVVKQINDLKDVGCEIVRVSILDDEDALAIEEIKKNVDIPIIADIHYSAKLAKEAVLSGADKIRINPGNMNLDELDEIIELCSSLNVPIRIGVNSGSVSADDLKKCHGDISKAMVRSIGRSIKYFESKNFFNLVLSIKSSDPFELIKTNKMLSKKYSYPLHIGLTEAGPFEESVIKSTFALGGILKEGIGNTIRVSITGDPVKEISVCKNILSMFGLYNKVNLISCPTCGRLGYNMEQIINEIKPFLDTIKIPLNVAIMGCPVNGPGEAKNADIGVAGGKDKAVFFKKGEIIKTINQEEVVEVLKEEINKLVGEYHG